MLTMLTAEHGKIGVKARGVRRKGSPLAAACELFVFGEFVIFESGGRRTLESAVPVEMFFGLREDLSKFSLAAYFSEFMGELSQSDDCCGELLRLALNCLYALSKDLADSRLIKAAFELRALAISGFSPGGETICEKCGECADLYFDFSDGKVYCSECLPPAAPYAPCGTGVLDAVRYIISCDLKRIFAFELGEDGKDKLYSLAERYAITQLERRFKTLDYYDKIKG